MSRLNYERRINSGSFLKYEEMKAMSMCALVKYKVIPGYGVLPLLCGG